MGFVVQKRRRTSLYLLFSSSALWWHGSAAGYLAPCDFGVRTRPFRCISFGPPLSPWEGSSKVPSRGQVSAAMASRYDGGTDGPNGGENTSEERRYDSSSNATEFFFPVPSPHTPSPVGCVSSEKQRILQQVSSLYDPSELMNVLSVHQEFFEAEIMDGVEDSTNGDQTSSSSSKSSGSLSLHDIIMQTTRNIDDEIRNGESSFAKPDDNVARASSIDPALVKRISQIRAIASDVDGTLLTSQQTLHPRTRLAVRQAVTYTGENDFSTARDSLREESGDGPAKRLDVFFPATGKSRKGAMDSLGVEMATLLDNAPGVYLQGLYCVDGNGSVILEEKLPRDAIEAAENLAKSHGISVVGYDGDDLYTTNVNSIVVHLHEHYGEPMPKLFQSSSGEGSVCGNSLSEHKPSMHKLLLMDDDVEKLALVRPQLEELGGKYGACVTQALPTMLEWLPAGASKAKGVAAVCAAMGIDPSIELLALGDAENDAEMLTMAAIGVAMGNGCPLAKESADHVMTETNDEGAAGAAIETFIGGFGI